MMLSLLVFPEYLRARIRLVRSVSRFWAPTKSRKVFTGLIEETMVFAEYSTPLDGRCLCGAGTHPGGNLFGLAGLTAAKKILRESIK